MDGPRWAHHRVHDRWSTLLLRFGFEQGVLPCLGVLRSTGGAAGVMLLGAPGEEETSWHPIASRGVDDPEGEVERLSETLSRSGGLRYPNRIATRNGTAFLIPVRDGGLLGVLVIWNIWGRSVSRSDCPYLLELAALLAKAWGREKHVSRIENALRLSSVGNFLGAVTENEMDVLEPFVRSALEQLCRVVPFDCCSIYGLDWETFRIEPLLSWRSETPIDLYEEEQFLLGGGLKSLALEQGKTIMLKQVANRPFSSYAAVPASAAGDAFRAVGTFGARTADVFSARRLDCLESFMKKLVATWSMWVQLRRWKLEALHDEVTGLLNKRSCLRHLEAAWTEHLRDGGSLSVALFDLDHFKQINDTFGHLAGDVILGSFGEILRNSGEQMGSPCRFGGEEFLLLMPSKDLREAVLVSDEIRKNLSQRQWRTQLGAIRATVSCGVAEALRDGASGVEELVALADTRLYLAKNRGRNRVVFSD